MKYLNYLKNKNLSKQTIYVYIKYANKFLDFCQNRKISKTLFRNYLLNNSKGYSPNSTRLVYYATLAYLKFIKCKWIKDVNFKLPKLEEFPRQIIDIKFVNEKLEQLSNSFYDKRTKLLIKLLISTGIRCCEVTNINKNSLYDNKLKIIGKGNKTRFVFINNEIKTLINEWKFNYFLVDKRGRKITDKQLRKILEEFGSKNNIKIYPHMLRRTFCTELIKKGCNLKVIQKLMGHSNISVTSRYIELSEDEMFLEYSKAF